MTTGRHQLPTRERALELFDYDPETGVLTWRVKRNGRGGGVRPGMAAGSVCPAWGYIIVGADGFRMRAHRLIWLMVTGEEPPPQLDHRDGNRQNNRWVNLRASGHGLNQQNVGKRPSAAGLRGVYRARERWVAQISVEGQKRHLGVFDSVEEASATYLRARAQTFPYQPVPREHMAEAA